jgi:hypothetical protein
MPSLINNPRLFFLTFISLVSLHSTAQNIAFNFYSTGTGQNLTINYAFEFEKSELVIGIGYTINKIALPDDQQNVFYKRQYATEPLQHLNLNIYYHYIQEFRTPPSFFIL